jgi:2-methylcitrate dehydratase PrpD
MAAYLAKDGFTGAAEILEGPQGMAAGMSTDANPAKLNEGLGTRWATPETSFKYHASCRHTHPAADALLQVMQAHQLEADLAQVVTHVHQGAIDVLGPVVTAGHGAPEQVLDGHGAGSGGALRPCGPGRV